MQKHNEWSGHLFYKNSTVAIEGLHSTVDTARLLSTAFFLDCVLNQGPLIHRCCMNRLLCCSHLNCAKRKWPHSNSMVKATKVNQILTILLPPTISVRKEYLVSGLLCIYIKLDLYSSLIGSGWMEMDFRAISSSLYPQNQSHQELFSLAVCEWVWGRHGTDSAALIFTFCPQIYFFTFICIPFPLRGDRSSFQQIGLLPSCVVWTSAICESPSACRISYVTQKVCKIDGCGILV